MRKTYQNEDIGTSQPTVPDAVSVALAELVGEVQEGLLALAVGTGLQVLTALICRSADARYHEFNTASLTAVLPSTVTVVGAGLSHVPHPPP